LAIPVIAERALNLFHQLFQQSFVASKASSTQAGPRLVASGMQVTGRKPKVAALVKPKRRETGAV